MNTVHVFDVVRALYFLARKADAGSVWNLADKGDTSEGGWGWGGNMCRWVEGKSGHRRL